MSYLWFVTLNTGSADRTSQLDEVATHPAALDLARALRDGRTAIGGRPGYDLQAMTVGPALLATIWRGKVPLTTFGVAARSLGAEKLWRMLHDSSAAYGLATSADSMPEPPWCAVRVEPALLTDLSAAAWLAAYEIEVAWAWTEKRHRGA